jgi:hypothetical protein
LGVGLIFFNQVLHHGDKKKNKTWNLRKMPNFQNYKIEKKTKITLVETLNES